MTGNGTIKIVKMGENIKPIKPTTEEIAQRVRDELGIPSRNSKLGIAVL